MDGERTRANHDNAAAADGWTRALLATLSDAREHLQQLIFAERWDDTRRQHDSDEAALRASARDYERGLADLYRFIRASGLPDDAVDWSRFKADQRRAATEAGVEITLRTALNEALYAAETTPLGDHAAYLAWATALTAFLAARAAGAPPRPAGDEGERLQWAYQTLADLEAHARFHAALAAFAGPQSPAVAHGAALLPQPRFDLTLNAALRWLADAMPASP